MKLFTPANIITLGNLLCGILGIYHVFNGALETAIYFGVAGLALDFADGFVARLTKIDSPIGAQLDSLADVVTFGVLPSFVFFKLINVMRFGIPPSQLSFFVLIIALFTALRLAKFNIDVRQSDKFFGLPSPANALLIFSFPFVIEKHPDWIYYLTEPWVYISISLLLCYLLIAEIPMFSLKFKNYSFKENKTVFIFLFVSLILLVTLKFLAVPIIIFSYILISIYQNQTRKNAV